MSRLLKGNRGWQLSGLKGLDYNGLNSVLNQVLSQPGCPDSIVISDINETFSSIDLHNSQVRQMLWQKL